MKDNLVICLGMECYVYFSQSNFFLICYVVVHKSLQTQESYFQASTTT